MAHSSVHLLCLQRTRCIYIFHTHTAPAAPASNQHEPLCALTLQGASEICRVVVWQGAALVHFVTMHRTIHCLSPPQSGALATCVSVHVQHVKHHSGTAFLDTILSTECSTTSSAVQLAVVGTKQQGRQLARQEFIVSSIRSCSC